MGTYKAALKTITEVNFKRKWKNNKMNTVKLFYSHFCD